MAFMAFKSLGECMNACIGVAGMHAMLHWYCTVAYNAAMGVDMCVLLCVFGNFKGDCMIACNAAGVL